jgi:transposase InsO family protein
MQAEEKGRKQRETHQVKSKKSSSGGARRGKKNTFRLKRKAVRLYLEEGIPAVKVAKMVGVCHQTIHHWAALYKEHGEAALKQTPRKKASKKKTAGPVREKIVEMKREHPQYGSRRISDTLRRIFFLKASPETVRKTLREEQLIEGVKPKPNRNPPKPRFFERSTPNQLWQSDIFTFRLGGKNAYLIGYIDDYSRFITGMDLFRSQTAENVISVYRIATGEYKPPKEMLTDNGRQYTNWRGVTKFERELQKDRVKHLRSRPHHPMTLGKIERFWKTIFTEFLSRAQFDSFENARSRIRFWIKYYNHKRPHQGIGGLCPADRFFEIHSSLKKTIERGIEENVLEMALRGKPKSPFYMVGRMGQQSVVIRAEKGKVKMMVDGKDEGSSQELEYQLEGGDGHGKEIQGNKEREKEPAIGDRPLPGNPVGVVGAQKTLGGLPDPGHQVDGAAELGEAVPGGDAESASAAEEAGPGPDPVPAPCETLKEDRGEGGAAGRPFGEAVSEDSGIEVGQGDDTGFEFTGEKEGIVNERQEEYGAGACAEEDGSDPAGESGEDDREGGGRDAGDIEEDLLRVGGAGASGDDGGAFESAVGPSQDGDGPGEGAAQEEGGGPRDEAFFSAACGSDSKDHGGSSELEGAGPG